MTKDLRVGVIGAGDIAVRGHIPGYKATDGVEVVALCDVKEERVRSTAAKLGIPHTYTDYREMLAQESPDLVSVCSPNAFHTPMAIAALEAGANVLCEKPMALTYADACAMVETSKRVNRILTVGFNNRYRPEMQAAKEIMRSGKLGDLYYAKASLLRRSGIPGYGSWFTNRDLAGGGAIMDIGCHILDLTLWLLDHPKPVSVSGATYAMFGPQAKALGTWGADHYPAGARFDVDDLTTAFVRFANGLTLTLEASWAGHNTDGERLQIFGTEGGIEVNPKLFGKEQPVHIFGEDEEGLTEEPIDFAEAAGPSYQLEISDLVSAIHKGRPPLVTGEQAAMVVQIVEAIYESADKGAEVILS